MSVCAVSFRSRSRMSVLAVSLLALALSGCSMGTSSLRDSGAPTAAQGLRGSIFGGQQPIIGATVELWAASDSNGAASTPLLSHTVTTTSTGSFDITGLYSCPTTTTQVYITAIHGNPGLPDGTDNTALTMMAALGPCGALGSSTYIHMNEVTTVGAVFALAPYMTSYSAIGSSSPSDLVNAFTTANQYVNFSTGTPTGPEMPAGYGVDTRLIYTVADILATCVNSDGSTADGTACGKLFNLTGGSSTSDIASAAQHMAQNSTSNTAELFDLIPPNAPFQQIYTAPPASLAVSVKPKVATPVISPNGGTYSSAQTVSITDSTDGATIYYTKDGSDPTTSGTAQVYSGSFTMSSTGTVNAIASHDGDFDSAVASASFTIGATSQSGIITTVAGTGQSGYTGDGGQATGAEVDPYDLAFDANGNLYFSDWVCRCVRKLNSNGVISTFAGNGAQGYSGDGGQATSATLGTPTGIAFDHAGNLYIADSWYHVIRKVAASGVISTAAGTGEPGYNGDNIPATSAQLWAPQGLAVDSSDNLYVSDTNNFRVRKINSAGVISTFAGNGTNMNDQPAPASFGDGGPATEATLGTLQGLAFDASGSLYITDVSYGRIHKVAPSGVFSTIAGNGSSYSGDGSQATSAGFGAPGWIALDASGNLYVSDAADDHIRKMSSTGIVTTVAGNGSIDFNGDGVPATEASLSTPYGIAIDASGNLYIADSNHYRIRKVNH